MTDTPPVAEDPPPQPPAEEDPQILVKEADSPTNETVKEPFENKSAEVVHNEESLNNMTKEELIELYKNSNIYINNLETKLANFEGKLRTIYYVNVP